MPLEPPHLDPFAGEAAAINEVFYANVFEGLTSIGSPGDVLPNLAESWAISDYGKTYSFKLLSGVNFSLDRVRDENSVNAQKGLFAPIGTVEVIYPSTVKVILKNPLGSFFYNLGWGDAMIVAPETAYTRKEKPFGTDTLKFQNCVKGLAITLVKANGYCGDPVAFDKADSASFPTLGLQSLPCFRGCPGLAQLRARRRARPGQD